MAINIKQVTNFDLINNRTYPPSPQNVVIAGGQETRNVNYKYFNFGGTSSNPIYINKFSYCCEPKAIIYPLKLVFSGGKEKWFQIGKTGMLEVQTEDFKDINDSTSETIIIETPIQGVYLPWEWIEKPNPLGFNFTFEYIIEL